MVAASYFHTRKTINKTGRIFMSFTEADDSRIETRFVWGRCSAKDARAMRDLIRAFQSDGWPTERDDTVRKHSRRSSAR